MAPRAVTGWCETTHRAGVRVSLDTNESTPKLRQAQDSPNVKPQAGHMCRQILADAGGVRPAFLAEARAKE